MAEAEADNRSPNPPARINWRGELAKFRQPGPTQIGMLVGAVALLALTPALVSVYGPPCPVMLSLVTSIASPLFMLVPVTDKMPVLAS